MDFYIFEKKSLKYFFKVFSNLKFSFLVPEIYIFNIEKKQFNWYSIIEILFGRKNLEDLEKNQKKTKTRIIISIVLTILIILVAAYLTNNKYRNFIDNKFFNKKVKENYLD